jgi:hypothetical protein
MSMRGSLGQLAILCCLLASLHLAGCAAPDTKDNSTDDIDMDRLWREGYGFNNPNAERIRQGLPPLDYSGRVSRQRSKPTSSTPTITLPPVKLNFD